jgi:hypothetical protein
MLGFFTFFRRKIRRKNWRFLTQIIAKLCKMLIITLVVEKNANFFAENCPKTAENCDHNIDPWHWDCIQKPVYIVTCDILSYYRIRI